MSLKMRGHESLDRYEKAFRHLKPTPDERILDGGCREGWFIRKCNEKGIAIV